MGLLWIPYHIYNISRGINHGFIEAAISVLWGSICNDNIYGDICAISQSAMGTYAETLQKKKFAKGGSTIY